MQTDLMKILEIIKKFLQFKKQGYIRVNMRDGGITTINKKETFELDKIDEN